MVNLIINSLSNNALSGGKGSGEDLKTALLIELPKGWATLLGINLFEEFPKLQPKILTASTAPLLAWLIKTSQNQD